MSSEVCCAEQGSASRVREVILLLCLAVGCCVSFWAPQYMTCMDILEWVQKMATQMMDWRINMRGETERAGTVRPGEEKAPWWRSLDTLQGLNEFPVARDSKLNTVPQYSRCCLTSAEYGVMITCFVFLAILFLIQLTFLVTWAHWCLLFRWLLANIPRSFSFSSAQEKTCYIV